MLLYVTLGSTTYGGLRGSRSETAWQPPVFGGHRGVIRVRRDTGDRRARGDGQAPQVNEGTLGSWEAVDLLSPNAVDFYF